MLRNFYAGRFDPSTTLADFSRQALSVLGREYLLLGHLIDRIGIPLVVQRYGQDDQVRFSIEEWMGASPIYSLRMQRALGFEGDRVETVFKNLDAICEAVNPYARCHPVENPTAAALAWDVVIDRNSDPQEETPLMSPARLSLAASFELMQRRPLRG